LPFDFSALCAGQLGNRSMPRHRARVNSAPRTAFVLGAGLGTRLRPLTNRRPKPLIPVANRPLITHAFDHLIAAGVERFVVNTHWCAERYAEFFPDGKWRGHPITFVHESPEVLETAGGIWHARAHLGDSPFIVYNGDILSDLPLAPALDAHRAAATKSRSSSARTAATQTSHSTTPAGASSTSAARCARSSGRGISSPASTSSSRNSSRASPQRRKFPSSRSSMK
jgi:GTP:adenosylcobinamide-phosphate guanylyltransferase